MKKLIVLTCAALLWAGASVSVEAQARCGGRARGVNRRQHRQQGRIYRGVRSGELTRRETLRLQREQFAVRREEWRYRRDGVVTPRERAELHRELNQASRHIYRAKHN